MKQSPTVIITGASIGIGNATAHAFARSGYRVVITDILKDEGRQLAASINSAGGVAEFMALDVGSTEECNHLLNKVVSSHGRLDCVVANAGIARKARLDEMSDDAWDETMNIDLKGTFRVVRAAAPAMSAEKKGAIICVSSVAGAAYGWSEHVHYTAAKAGIVGFVRGAAAELAGSGIRVNGVAPGLIRTAQSMSNEHSLGADGLAQAASYIPLGRVGEPEDVAEVILFLAGEGARYVTGQVLLVDGGLLAAGRY